MKSGMMTLGLVALALAFSLAEPAPGLAQAKVGARATAPASEPATTQSVESGREEQAACAKIRKKLWVEGEGWIVRRVAVCT